MKQVWVNELRNLRPHIRENFLSGRQCYKDQANEPRVEEEHLQRLQRSGVQGSGRRIGILARTDTSRRSPHKAPGS